MTEAFLGQADVRMLQAYVDSGESEFSRRVEGRTSGGLSLHRHSNSSSATGKPPLIKTGYKKKHSPSLGIRIQDQSFHLRLKKQGVRVRTCAM